MMRTAISFLPLLRPCCMSEDVTLRGGRPCILPGQLEGAAAPCSRHALLTGGKPHLSTMGHCAFLNRFFWYRPAVCGTYRANLGFTAM